MAPMKTPPTAGMVERSSLSLAAAARQLNVTTAELRRRLSTGEITFQEVAGELRIPRSALAGLQPETGPASKRPRTKRSGPLDCGQ